VVNSGTQEGTLTLSTVGGNTITPGTGEKIAVEMGKFTTGAVKVAGDENLKEANIVKGVTIFGVPGTHECEGGVDTSTATATAGDIVDGKTAFLAEGETTGTMTRATSISVTDNTPTISSGKLTLSSTYKSPNGKNTYISPTQNTTVKITADVSSLGNATAADVASGKTFTSSAGVKVTGTATIGGGGGNVSYNNEMNFPVAMCSSVAYYEIPLYYAKNQPFKDTYSTFYVFIDMTIRKLAVSENTPCSFKVPTIDFSSGSYDIANGYLRISHDGTYLTFTITNSSMCAVDDPVVGFAV
jgi:hypothetical protein